MRRLITCALAIAFFVGVPASSKSKPKSYETGKLLDISVQEVTRGIGMIGSMAAPIRGKLYEFQIGSGDLIYFADYSAGKLSYKPQWVVNDPIEFRVEEDKMFLKRPDDKELEVQIVKRIRQESNQH